MIELLKKAIDKNIIIYDDSGPDYISRKLIGLMIDFSIRNYDKPLTDFYVDIVRDREYVHDYETICGFKLKEASIDLSKEYINMDCTFPDACKRKRIILGMGDGIALLGGY